MPEENKNNGLRSKYIEFILGGLVTIVLFGVLVWAVNYFTTKIDNIEETIAAHHGPQWKEIEKVIAVGKLQEITEQLEKKSRVIEKWIAQGDKIMQGVQNREYEAYSHLTKKIRPNELSALLNTAHINGTRFNTGDELKVINIDSGARESVIVKVISTYSDMNHTDVLIQLGEAPAEIIGLSETLGKVRVMVKRKELDLEDPRRWKPFDELMRAEKH